MEVGANYPDCKCPDPSCGHEGPFLEFYEADRYNDGKALRCPKCGTVDGEDKFIKEHSDG